MTTDDKTSKTKLNEKHPKTKLGLQTVKVWHIYGIMRRYQ